MHSHSQLSFPNFFISGVFNHLHWPSVLQDTLAKGKGQSYFNIFWVWATEKRAILIHILLCILSTEFIAVIQCLQSVLNSLKLKEGLEIFSLSLVSFSYNVSTVSFLPWIFDPPSPCTKLIIQPPVLTLIHNESYKTVMLQLQIRLVLSAY